MFRAYKKKETKLTQTSKLLFNGDVYVSDQNNTHSYAEFKPQKIESLKIENVSKFGRNFSIVRVPYAFKLLLQELSTMNVTMRIITEDNIDNFKDKDVLDKAIQYFEGIDQEFKNYFRKFSEIEFLVMNNFSFQICIKL